MAINPHDLEIASFFLLVLLFELWERWRPAQSVNRLADLKVDVLSFAMAVLVNRLSTRLITSGVDAISPAFVVDWVHSLQALPGTMKILLAIFVEYFII
jgi:hypothetical protein